MDRMDMNIKMREIQERLAALDSEGDDGIWKSIPERRSLTNAPSASVSAQHLESSGKQLGSVTCDEIFLIVEFPRTTINLKHAEIEGYFTAEPNEISNSNEGIFSFCIKKGSRLIYLPCTNYLVSVIPLINYFIDNDYTLRLMGTRKKHRLLVNGFTILSQAALNSQNTQPKPRKTAHFFQFVLDKLLSCDRAQKQGESQIPSILHSKDDLMAAFEICRHMYPQNIQVWADQNFEIANLPQLDSITARHTVNALRYILCIDWTGRNIILPSIQEVEDELNAKFYGLEQVKKQILSVVAQIKQSHTLPNWGILLTGPAGVGKTSIAYTISEILGLPQAYLDFSSIRDSEALTGSSRIYGNAKPGAIIEQLFACQTSNIVMVLNEIDKAAGCYRGGNPLDVLLSLLDGTGFTDTYIETAIPTDKIMFIATCNDTSKLSKPLLDRFHKIDIPAYTRIEKKNILESYVMPKLKSKSAIRNDELDLTEAAINLIISKYSFDPGVRDIERICERIISDYLLAKEISNIDHAIYDESDVNKLLGPPQIIENKLDNKPGIAMCSTLIDGKAIVFPIEVAILPGQGGLKLINVNGTFQSQYCELAYSAINSMLSGILCKADTIIALPKPIPDNISNDIGFAACTAILSALTSTKLPPKAVFIGGCDLMGNVSIGTNMISTQIDQLDGKVDMICTGVGAANYIHDYLAKKSHVNHISIVEIGSIKILFNLLTQR